MKCSIDEQIVYNQLSENEDAIWSLLLASGYLKVSGYKGYREVGDFGRPEYELTITNLEVKYMFEEMVRGWFSEKRADYNNFVKALLAGDVEAMNVYMNRVAFGTFSYFDTGKNLSEEEPERFYHGFVLGLLVELQERYSITSNRESGFGRYDVMLEPNNRGEDDAIVLEFKVYNERREKDLQETVQAALKQIEEKKYDAYLLEKGIPAEHIRRYGFAFQGKTVLIG